MNIPMPGAGSVQLGEKPELDPLAEVPLSHLYTCNTCTSVIPDECILVPTVPNSPSTNGSTTVREVGERHQESGLQGHLGGSVP